MVKKSIFTLVLLAVFGWVSAQSLQFELNGEVLSDGQIVYCVDFNENFGEFIQDLQIRNISGRDLNVVVEKEEISVPEGSMNYYCWGSCFSPSVYISPAVAMPAGSVSGEGELGFHFMPATMSDFARIRYYAYEERTDERISVVVVFNSNENVGEKPLCTFGSAYPSPASSMVHFDYRLTGGNAVAVVYNLVGQEVMRQEMNGFEGCLNVSVADLKDGIYFCSVMLDGRTCATAKFVVKK